MHMTAEEAWKRVLIARDKIAPVYWEIVLALDEIAMEEPNPTAYCFETA